MAPSLQRLLSLDKSFDSLTQRCEEATRIIGLPEEQSVLDREIAGCASPDESRGKATHTARHEFVVRWLVEKLNKDINARKSPEAWSALYRTFHQLPDAVIAKTASTSTLLSTVTRTLADLFPLQETTVASVASNESQSESTPKKRKRNASDKEVLDHADRRVVFLSIAALLRLLLDTVNRPDSRLHASVRNQIRAALTLDTSKFAILLSHWLVAMLDFAPSHTLLISPSQPRVLSYSLDLIQELLALQPIHQQATPEDSFDLAFSNSCVSPAALLLARLQDASTSTLDQRSLVTKAIQIIERLLAQHLFVPARSAFHAAAEHRIPGKILARRNDASLDDRLAPFHREITHVYARSASAGPADAIVTYQRSLPHLLDLAVRCTPTATPKQKIAEAPWLDALFTSLSHVLDTNPDSATRQTLADMVNVILNSKLVLSRELLIRLVSVWSGLESGQPDLRLVANLLAMDPSLFTDVKTPRTQALFDALSAHGRIKRQDSASSVTREVLSDSIAVPLMKAFAKIRSLTVYLDQWSTQIQKHSAWEDYEWFVWTDQSLLTALRTVLEVSLNTTQISDLLESGRASLVAFGKDKTSATSHELAAAAIILNAVAGSVHSDAAIDGLQTTLHSLIETVQETIGFISTGDALITASLLALLSRLYILWFPAWSTTHSYEEIDTHLDTLLASQAVETSMVAIEEVPTATTAQLRVADAAFAFIAAICDLMRRVPGQNDNVKALFSGASSSQDEGVAFFAVTRPMAFFTTITQFPCLLEHLPQVTRQAAFERLLVFATQDTTTHQVLTKTCFDSVVASTSHAVRDDLFSTLISRHDVPVEAYAARSLLSRWSSQGLARQQREKILDLSTDGLLHQELRAATLEPQLSLMINLMDIPNATAKISTDSSTILSLASALSTLEYSAKIADIFGEMCALLFNHIVDTKEQTRSNAFLTSLSKSLAEFMTSKQPLQSSAPKLRLLTSFMSATEARMEKEALSEFPHRSPDAVDSIVKKLYQTLSSSIDEEDISEASRRNGVAIVVQAYISMPSSFLSNGGSSSSKYSKRFTKLLGSLLRHLSSSASSAGSISVSLPVQVQCFENLAPVMIGDNPEQFCSTAELLLRQDLDPAQHHAVLNAFAIASTSISDSVKLSLIDSLLSTASDEAQITAQRISLARCLILSFKDGDGEVDSVSILPTLLALLSECAVFEAHCELVTTVVSILRNKPNLVTQYSIEATISTTIGLLSPSSALLPASRSHQIFDNLCDITRALLQFHRPSLSGRYHVLVPLLQRVLSCLFIPTSRDSGSASRFKHATWTDNKAHPFTIVHAQRASRLLENLCNPPQSDISKRNSRGRKDPGHELVDLARKARVQVGQHVQHILHYFCTLILNGRLGDGVRDALQPGLWAVMDVVEIGSDERRGVKALSAGMSNAERAVLRGMWEDWRRFGGWSG